MIVLLVHLDRLHSVISLYYDPEQTFLKKVNLERSVYDGWAHVGGINDDTAFNRCIYDSIGSNQ